MLKQRLRSVGFTRSWYQRYSVCLVLVAAVALVGAISHLAGNRLSGFFEARPSLLPALVTAVVGLTALVLAFQQWRGQRNEICLDKFYERLNAANDKLDAWHDARPFVLAPDAPLDDPSFRRVMYVYRELDNLEYGIAKYKLGHMNTENAYRCLRTFVSRCTYSAEFRDMALEQVEANLGYAPETRRVVRAAAELAERREQRIPVPRRAGASDSSPSRPEAPNDVVDVAALERGRDAFADETD